MKAHICSDCACDNNVFWDWHAGEKMEYDWKRKCEVCDKVSLISIMDISNCQFFLELLKIRNSELDDALAL